MSKQAQNRGAASGLRPIGSLTRGIANTHGDRATAKSRSMPSPSTSSPTTPTDLDGPRPGSSGTVVTVPGEPGSARKPVTQAEALAFLEAATPGEIEDGLRGWLPPSIASGIEAVWRSRPGSDPAVWDDAYISDYRLKVEIGTKAAREALALVELLDQVAERREYAKALGCLKVLTVAKHMMAEDLALQIDTMASEMTEYPLDVARDACRAWARANKFFPSWAELRELCEDGVRFRRALARELRRILDGLDQEAEAAPAAPPACAVWEDNLPKVKAELGEAAWRSWLSQATPYSDDGETLILAVATEFIGREIRKMFGPELEHILERRVMFVIKTWAGAVARARLTKE